MLISEIFFSFQGEGPLIGYPQIFIRFEGCNLNCSYCDEKHPPAKKQTISEVLDIIKPLLKNKPHSISITGGEPLLQVDSIKELIKELPLPIYLETNGTLPNHLIEIADQVTWFSVDFKPNYESEFIDFLNTLSNKPNVFVKYVITKDFPIQEAQKLAKIIATINENIPLILQPVTAGSGYKSKASTKDITRAFNITRKHLENVRIIPQTHKIMNIK
jgi:7-carboxy-7-deazaguanine synthase